MGQQASKQHGPLTFAYINKAAPEPASDTVDQPEPATRLQDFVLANPHLYRLEMACENHCNQNKQAIPAAGSEEVNDDMIVATAVAEECAICRKSKRLSLVRNDLANDLEYVDKTYYPNIIHYMSNDDPMERELLQLESANGPVDNTHREVTKLTIGEVTPTRRRPRRLTSPSVAVDLSGKSLIKLSPSIAFLHNLTKLNLSHNKMKSLPPEIGYLKSLRFLNASHNELEEIPDTISFLSKLKVLNLGFNQLQQLPESMGDLPKLVIVILNDNKLTQLPPEMANLHDLISLNVSKNPLKSLPAEIATLQSLRRLAAEDCDFVEQFEYPIHHDPPSLFEQCARIAVRAQLSIPTHMSAHIKEYLAQPKVCSFCRGPFFESFVVRGRFIERVIRQPIALEYRLCKAHWTDNEDRIRALFADTPATATPIADSCNPYIDTEGLEPTTSSPSLGVWNRSRTYSGGSRSLAGISARSISLGPNRNMAEFEDFFPQSIPIQALRSHPSLPAMPTLETADSIEETPSASSSHSRPKLRPRASSSASVTKRLAGFLSFRSDKVVRSYSSSSLRRQVEDVSLNNTPFRLHENVDERPLPPALSNDSSLIHIATSNNALQANHVSDMIPSLSLDPSLEIVDASASDRSAVQSVKTSKLLRDTYLHQHRDRSGTV
ncbi:uncharacterized protein BYT42DRAFT_525453 [Radiomyces spectabilis]|uniref:uncharacterized protein n=1 Tax=Radiomyces spectabilis TaxID=64574 RepID=UPI0022207270|nr:uncharacterized protein BYT42DRAFT_525453 [Radiomyces spectabilis]KAI8394032.1 hypothetical protein BYT42DRAFT_525453 [Radiomyces spectabilis]